MLKLLKIANGCWFHPHLSIFLAQLSQLAPNTTILSTSNGLGGHLGFRFCCRCSSSPKQRPLEASPLLGPRDCPRLPSADGDLGPGATQCLPTEGRTTFGTMGIRWLLYGWGETGETWWNWWNWEWNLGANISDTDPWLGRLWEDLSLGISGCPELLVIGGTIWQMLGLWGSYTFFVAAIAVLRDWSEAMIFDQPPLFKEQLHTWKWWGNHGQYDPGFTLLASFLGVSPKKDTKRT